MGKLASSNSDQNIQRSNMPDRGTGDSILFFGTESMSQLTLPKSPKQNSCSISRNRLKLFSNITITSENQIFKFFLHYFFANVRYHCELIAAIYLTLNTQSD